MSATWHIVAKDVRRMLGPVAVWLAFVAATTLWFGTAMIDGDTDWVRWMDLVRGWSQLALGVQWFFTLLLVAVVVHEDPVVSDRAFWRTRPVGAARLFSAKLLTAALLFVVGPVVILTPIWLAMGFGAGAVGESALAQVATQVPLVLFGLLVAGLTRSLGQFLLVGLLLAAAQSIVGLVATAVGHLELSMALRQQRFQAVQGLMIVTLTGVGVHQFLTQKTRRSWALLGAGFVGVVLVGWSWRWDFRPDVERSGAGTVGVAVEQVFGQMGKRVPGPRHESRLLRVGLRVEPRGEDRVVIPVGGRGEIVWTERPAMPVTLAAEREIPETVLRARAAMLKTPPSMTYHLKLRATTEPQGRILPETVRWSGAVRLAEYRLDSIAELPVREGAEVQSDSCRLRLLAVGAVVEDRGTLVVLEQRDVWNWLREGSPSGTQALRTRRGVIERFVLKLPGTGGWHVTPREDLGSVSVRSVARGVFRIGVPAGVTAEQLAGAVLLRLRFELVREFEQAIPATDVTVVADQ